MTDLPTLMRMGILCERLKDKVRIIKHSKEVDYFQLDNVVAMSSGVEYCRENLTLCELTLYHSETDLKEGVAASNLVVRYKP